MLMSWDTCNKLVFTFGGECRGYKNYGDKSIIVWGALALCFHILPLVFFGWGKTKFCFNTVLSPRYF